MVWQFTTRTGKYKVNHRTSRKKLQTKKSVKEWFRENIHGSPSDIIELLSCP